MKVGTVERSNNINKKNIAGLTGTLRGLKRGKAMNSEREGGYEYQGNIGEHLLAEHIGEHLFAETENWNNREVEGKRRWGYKRMRIGEASQPGPMAEEI